MNLYKTTDNVRAGDFVQMKTARRFPRVWRRVPVGVEPAQMDRIDSNPIVGIAEHDAQKGMVLRVMVQGVVRMPTPRKLSRRERFVRWMRGRMRRE